MPLLLMVLLVPAVVDGIANEFPVVIHDGSYEEHFDVVFHSDQLRVINARFFRELLALLLHLDPDGREPKLGFLIE